MFVRLFRVGPVPVGRGVDVCDDLIVECSSGHDVFVSFVVFRRGLPRAPVSGVVWAVVEGAVVDALADSTDEGRVGPR